MNSPSDIRHSSLSQEWLEADGYGGFASGTATGIRTRRYHALLLTATMPPTGRMVLVNGFDAWIETPDGKFALTSQNYAPGVVHPDGAQRIERFETDPWPTWTFRFEDGTELTQEIFVSGEAGVTALTWRLSDERKGVKLFVRPLVSGRDYHSLHKENGGFRFGHTPNGEKVLWRPYDGVPGIYAMYSHNGRYAHEPLWYRNFLYEEERARGLDATEDLASPGAFEWDLSAGEAVWLLTPSNSPALALKRDMSTAKFLNCLRENERLRRKEFPSRLHRAADAYIVQRCRSAAVPSRSDFAMSAPPNNSERTSAIGSAAAEDSRAPGKTIIAGYPWFTDWGRDTFIALRGLCLAGGRLEDACEILLAWANVVSEGMLPNLFPDHGDKPEYNSVDASLWYVVAVHEYMVAAGILPAVEPGFQPGGKEHGLRRGIAKSRTVENSDIQSGRQDAALYGRQDACRHTFQKAILAILDGYSKGTRFGIRMDSDGLLAAGVPGVQLTWMDAKVGDWVVTPRIGKPVEIQALWLNALKIASKFSNGWAEHFERGLKSFRQKFWNEAGGFLYDVVDVNHQPDQNDASFRPNQIFAVGGLPFQLLEGKQAERIVAVVQEKLLTPLGLRSLAPDEPGYTPRYEGGVLQRDGSYHQGTVWPWLIGPFVEAWLRVRSNSAEAKREAREKFLKPLLAHLDEAGLGHISEIADAEAPHKPRGCPFQAWSVGEALRLDRVVLADTKEVSKRARQISTVEP